MKKTSKHLWISFPWCIGKCHQKQQCRHETKTVKQWIEEHCRTKIFYGYSSLMCRAFSFHRIILRIITSVPICSVFTAQNIQTFWKYSCQQQHFYFPQKLTGLCFPENQTWSLIWGHSSPAEPSPEQVEQSEAVRGHGQAYQNLQKRSKNKKRTDHVKGLFIESVWSEQSEEEETFSVGSFAVPVFSDAWWSVLTVLNTLSGHSLDQEQ